MRALPQRVAFSLRSALRDVGAAAAAAAAIALGAAASPAGAQGSLAGSSPFIPAAGAASAGGAAAAPADYELAGASVADDGTRICIVDSVTKHSRWIAVGETVDGIKALGYDSLRETAIVAIHGVRRDLVLRKPASVGVAKNLAGGVANRPVPGGPPGFQMQTQTGTGTGNAAVAQTAQPAGPGTSAAVTDASGATAAQKHDETEARMLVSDLLEIGIQQRKAYEDARQKAAAAGTPAAQGR